MEEEKMVFILKKNATETEIDNLEQAILSLGLKYRLVIGVDRITISPIGDEIGTQIENLEAMPGVEAYLKVQKPYKLVSRDSHTQYNHNQTRIVDVKGVKFGGDKPVIIAGPCAIEALVDGKPVHALTEVQSENAEYPIFEIAREMKSLGADMLRGGAYKPRTSPYDFQGLGLEGLKILKQASDETNLPCITEVVDTRDAEKVAEYADMLQIGARNMENFELLKEVGRTKKPVLLKRGKSSTMKEWLLAAEYIIAEGNDNIVLCARGIKNNVSEEYGRNQADFDIIYELRKETYLPVIADPSHIGGERGRIPSLAMSALASGAQGLIIEVMKENAKPVEVLCDFKQSLMPSQMKELMSRIKKEYN
jgi:3-deoxy-7-phosphoheptulonate synthase